MPTYRVDCSSWFVRIGRILLTVRKHKPLIQHVPRVELKIIYIYIKTIKDFQILLFFLDLPIADSPLGTIIIHTYLVQSLAIG